MHASPRLRRLRNDLSALEQLRRDSSIFSFSAQGNPPHHYQIVLKGRSLCRDRGHIRPLETHRIEIKLGASYPRTMPEIRWITPIYHPNISEIGMVCLGGYGTHWVPSLQLDELCVMLWDMARFHNYDIRSPYNRDAALWAANQGTIKFPTDSRSLRDLRAAVGRISPNSSAQPSGRSSQASQSEGSCLPRERIALRIRDFARRYTSIFGTPESHQLIQLSSSAEPSKAPVDQPARATEEARAESPSTGPQVSPESEVSAIESVEVVFDDTLEDAPATRVPVESGDEEIIIIA